MKAQKSNINFMVVSATILVAALSRIIPHPSNFTPVGAMALFGGCYFANKKLAYIIPVLALWIGDIVLNSTLYFHHLTFFYDGFLWIYGSFALIVLMGTFLKKVNAKNVLLAGILAALLHWVITDFGVWAGGTMYPKNFAGLGECYTAALPYLRNMLLGNIVFGGIMFGAFEFAKKRFPVLALSK